MIFDAKTEDIIKSIIGSFKQLGDHRKSSERTGVIEILSDDGNRFFVKIHNRLSHWNPEIYAYTHWIKPLEQYAPTLIASFNENDVFGMIVTPIQGKTVNEMQISNNIPGSIFL